MRIAILDICAIFVPLIWKTFYVSVHMWDIVFCYFLSFLDLFAMYAQCKACFCGETCFNHEGVLVLLCLNVFLNTSLADVFLRIDVK